MNFAEFLCMNSAFWKSFFKIKKREKQSISEHSREKQSKIIKFLKQKRFFHGFVKKIVDICRYLYYIYVNKLKFFNSNWICLKYNISCTFGHFSLWHTEVCLQRRNPRLHIICWISDAKQFWGRRFSFRQGENLQEYFVYFKDF